MKLSKKENPFDVQAGQVWKSKDKRRQNKFTVIRLDKWLNIPGSFAVAEYGKGKAAFQRQINLLRFGEYVRCK